jgi:hypothetical protein
MTQLEVAVGFVMRGSVTSEQETAPLDVAEPDG